MSNPFLINVVVNLHGGNGRKVIPGHPVLVLSGNSLYFGVLVNSGNVCYFMVILGTWWYFLVMSGAFMIIEYKLHEMCPRCKVQSV